MIKTNNISSNSKINIDANSESFSRTLIATFTAVFLAELGDKTQIATLLLSAESGKPVIVFIGAALALILSSLIGVLIGRLLANNVKPYVFQRISGLIMLAIAFYIIINQFKLLEF